MRTAFRYLLVLLCFYSCCALGQSPTSFFEQKVAPLAPETSNLGVYGALPMDLNSGAVNISVPITTVESGPISVPISLGYRTTGITVDETASWAGLGWALNAGGVITRTIRGMPDYDLGRVGYQVDWIRWRKRSRLSARDREDMQAAAADAKFDTEPDIYNVSAGGISAKIIFDTLGAPHIHPYANWKVAGSIQEGWTITTETGLTYLFQDKESTHSPDSPQNEVVTAWYLTYISSPDEAHGVSFTYRTHTKELMGSIGRLEREKLYGWSGALCRGSELQKSTCCPEDVPFDKYAGGVFNNITSLYLVSIASATTSVSFHSSDSRQDVGLTEDAPARKLDSIWVSDNTHNRITQRFHLTHTYSNEGSAQPEVKRLLLASVQEVGKPSYRFSYHLPDLIPPRRGFGQDHWGYANGANSNPSLLPKLSRKLSPYYVGVNAVADRAVNPLAAQYGMLQQIQYPTGGYTTLEYESNVVTISAESLPQFGEEGVEGTLNIEVGVSVPIDGPEVPMDELDLAVREALYIRNDEGFTAPYVDAAILDIPNGAQLLRAEPTLLFPHPTPGSPQVILQPYLEVRVYALPANGDISGLTRTGSLCFDQGCTALPAGLPAGKYLLVAAANAPDSRASLFLSVLPTKANDLVDRKVGGLRVKRMVDHPVTGPAIVKSFLYTRYDSTRQRTLSTGQLFFDPVYAERTACDNLILSAHDYNYLRVLYGGYHIGYDQVTTVLDEGAGGSVETRYLNSPDPANRSLVTQEITRNQAQQLVKQTQTEYWYTELSSVEAATVKRFRVLHTFTPGSADGGNGPKQVWFPIGYAEYNINAYYHYSGWQRPVRQKTITYTADGQHILRQEQQAYQYRPIRGEHVASTAPLLVRTTGANGQFLVTHTRRTADYDTTSSSYTGAALGVRQLLRKHVLEAPVEETTWRRRGADSVLLSGSLTHYQALRPTSAWKLETAAPLAVGQYQASRLQAGSLLQDARYRRQGTYEHYSALGNPLQIRRERGIPTAYLWGYGGTKPIAEVQEASYDRIAYTSFEPASTGSWLYDSTSTAARSAGGYTGSWHYTLTSQQPLKRPHLPAGTYQVEWWSSSDVLVQVEGNASPITSHLVGSRPSGWAHYRAVVTLPAPGTVVLMAPAGQRIALDEVRLSPVGARMSTYTHAPLIGITSQTGPDGRTIFYEYDRVGRLQRVRDELGRVLSENEYHYTQP